MKKNQYGMTLIELMISIIIGIIVTLGALSLFLAHLKTNSTQLKAIRLNQELRSALTIMSKDIRRSGHFRDAASNIGAANPFNQLSITNSNRTINFSYDAEDDGTTETYGYQLNTTSGTLQTCASTTTACTDWQDLTDGTLTNISALTFTQTTTSVGGTNLVKVSISLTGNLRTDTAFTRTLQETITLRN